MNVEDAARLQQIINRAFVNNWISDSEADHLDTVIEMEIS